MIGDVPRFVSAILAGRTPSAEAAVRSSSHCHSCSEKKMKNYLVYHMHSWLRWCASSNHSKDSSDRTVVNNQTLVPWGTDGHFRFPTSGGLDDANCEPALQPYEVYLAIFSGRGSIRYGNTTRLATSRGVHFEGGDGNSLNLICVPPPPWPGVEKLVTW